MPTAWTLTAHRMHQEDLQGAGHFDHLIQCRLVMEKGMLSKITIYIYWHWTEKVTPCSIAQCFKRFTSVTVKATQPPEKEKLKPLFIPHELQAWSHPGLFRRFPIFNAKLSGCNISFSRWQLDTSGVPQTATQQRWFVNCSSALEVNCSQQPRAVAKVEWFDFACCYFPSQWTAREQSLSSNTFIGCHCNIAVRVECVTSAAGSCVPLCFTNVLVAQPYFRNQNTHTFFFNATALFSLVLGHWTDEQTRLWIQTAIGGNMDSVVASGGTVLANSFIELNWI